MPMSSTHPTFSVIIATYNGAATLSRAVDSVLAQSYKNFEIIVVDDGSTDDTPAVIRRYGAKVHYHLQPNSGVSNARNTGAKLARGEWLAFLDVDDWYYPHRLAWHARLLQRQPDLDFLIGDYDYGRANGEVMRRAIDSSGFGAMVLASADEHDTAIVDLDDMAQFIPSYFGHTSTFSVPRRTFLRLGGYAESFSIGEDLHLLIRACARSRSVGIVCKPMAFYCVHDAGLMRSDTVSAQIRNVETLLSLKHELEQAPAPVKRGFLKALMNARFDLAVALIRNRKRLRAIASFLPALADNASLHSFRMLLSVMKG
jgi:glycosyltransferase involved in cell wall biosynthesis